MKGIMVPLALDKQILDEGIRYIVEVNAANRTLWTGTSGSGKSYALLLALGKLALLNERKNLNVVVTFCNYKADDTFSFLRGQKDYYEYTDCWEGLNEYYDSFSQRLSGNSSDRNLHVLVFDEWQAFYTGLLNNGKQGKEQAQQALNMMSSILVMSRSLRMTAWLATQRPNATLFTEGSKDNFETIIFLGRISKEARQMVFSEYSELVEANHKTGCGYLLTNGVLREIQIPTIRNMPKLQDAVKSLFC